MLKTGPVWALGTMSGTSLDGVDAALVQTDGLRLLAFGDTGYRAYSPVERGVLRAALGHWPGSPEAAAAAIVVEDVHAELLSRFSGADVVGFHGQTLAQALGLPVVWDFRSNDVGLGGQGAPLAPFYHHACAAWIGAQAPMAFLNMGGVGNLTWVDPRVARPDLPGACLAFDTGPANAPVDDLMMARRGVSQDEGGALAAVGQPDRAVLAAFLDDPYFYRMPPKSLDRNAFPGLSQAVRHLSDADAAATLTAAAAAAVRRGAEHFPGPATRLLVSGGGRHNATLMAMLGDAIPGPVDPVEVVGLDGDMLEAQAFAYLAVRVLRGLPTSAPGTTGVAAPVGGGRVSRPS